MRYLVVFAHPSKDSFQAALHATVVEALINAGHEVDDLDLYAIDFQPVLSVDERFMYHNVESNISNVSEHVKRLRFAEGIVFVFPTWCNGMPAILKGYFDRIWVPGVAFEIVDGKTRPLLFNIQRLCIVTSYGSPFLLNRLYVGDPNRRWFMRGIRRLMPNARTLWLAQYGMDRANERTRRNFIRKLKRKIVEL